MSKPNIAVFSPVNPAPSGISDYCESMLLLLKEDYKFSLFLDGYKPQQKEILKHFSHYSADEFETVNKQKPFDLIIYQVGNSPHHNYIYPFLFRFPGLLILHDAWLTGTMLDRALGQWRGDQFREEMKATYGSKGETAAEIILSGLHNQYFLRHFSLTELPIRASAMTAVHNSWLARELSKSEPEARIESVPHLVFSAESGQKTKTQVRSKLGISEKAFVVGSFGLLSPEKRIEQLLNAFARLLETVPEARCLLVGAVGDNLNLEKIVRDLRLQEQVIMCGRLPMDEFNESMCACDAMVQLRWPTRRETSGIVIRAMNFGIPVVVSRLAHLEEFPQGSVEKISLLNETQELEKTIKRLANFPDYRLSIGRSGQEYIQNNYGTEKIRDKWKKIISKATELAIEKKDLEITLPNHLRKSNEG